MSELKHFTDQNFVSDVIQSDKPVLVDFWAEWCAPCRAMGPEIQKAAVELGDDVVVGKCNVDESRAIASKLGIMSIPTLALFKDGDAVWSAAGMRPAAVLVKEVRAAIAATPVQS